MINKFISHDLHKITNSAKRLEYIKTYCERPYKVNFGIEIADTTQQDILDEFSRFQTSLEETPQEQTEQWTTAMLKEMIFG